MKNSFVKLASLTVILLLCSAVAGHNMSAYAVFSHPPSFGGGKINNYADGLTINGQIFDISKFSQKFTTPQILPVGKSSTVTLKMFDSAGPSTIKSVTLGVNVQGNSFAYGDTYVQYTMRNHYVAVVDPHKLIGSITADYSSTQPYVYVTFHITPGANMEVSNLVLSVTDDHNANTNALVINALKFS
ncbi:MAG: hypothetical protein KGI28_05540 [Thaumarchaeota archaeon]|nr:hypothetical protein [Nitrososphaerota archaeon]